MTSMIERTAQAIYHCWAKKRQVTETWEELVRLNHSVVTEARDEARAAIEAMREPNAEMHKAGNDKMDSMDDGDGDAFCEHIWRIMIDAALSSHLKPPPQVGLNWGISDEAKAHLNEIERHTVSAAATLV